MEERKLLRDEQYFIDELQKDDKYILIESD
jgi:hypothetical protein